MTDQKTDVLLQKLIQYFAIYKSGGICIAFSGGADSSLLLKAACIAAKGNRRPVLAVTFETRLHPHSDTLEAAMLAESMGAFHKVIKIDEFSNPEILKNPTNRCYLCKKLLFETLIKAAESLDYGAVFDGSNYDDGFLYRPGLAALKELNIMSPLKELGITKKEVRMLLDHLEIRTARKPSAPCLATRLPYNTPFDYQLLNQLHKGEEFLREIGFYNIRLRYHHPIIRIEVDKKDFPQLLKDRERIILFIKSLGFLYITLDLEGFRSGSMDIPATILPDT